MNYNTAVSFEKKQFKLKNYLSSIGIDSVKEEITEGLKSAPKYISSKFFYDDKGSVLFEKITRLPEYYPTRTEKSILSKVVSKLNLDYNNLNIIELGSGDHGKISLFLNQIPEPERETIRYYPVDISQLAIEQSYKNLSKGFPMIEVHGIIADFIHQVDVIPKKENRIFCFFGSTLGNFDTEGIKEFMTNFGCELQSGDRFLLGLDMVKEKSVLERAYNDEKGITAQFNLNILNVIRDLSGINLDPDNFEHLAFFNDKHNRIEMHLTAKRDMSVRLSEGEEIEISKGETIHTENSHKFDRGFIDRIAEWAGIEVRQIFSDEREWFSLVYFSKK